MAEFVALCGGQVLLGYPHVQASDVYALGLVLWEIVSGSTPFHDHGRYDDIKSRVRCQHTCALVYMVICIPVDYSRRKAALPLFLSRPYLPRHRGAVLGGRLHQAAYRRRCCNCAAHMLGRQFAQAPLLHRAPGGSACDQGGLRYGNRAHRVRDVDE